MAGLGLAMLAVPAAAEGSIPADIAGISTVALIVLGLGAYVYMGKRKDMGTVILAVGALMALGVFSLAPASIAPGGMAGQQGSVECGKAATLTWTVYDDQANSETIAVSPVYYAYSATGAKLLSAATTNTTSAATCDLIDIYIDEDASWYGDPILDVPVTTERATINGHASNVVTETNLNLSLLDSDYNAVSMGTCATSADNNCDFQVGLGQGQSKVLYAKLTNLEANAMFKLCGASIAYNNYVKDLEMDDPAWEEIPCWEEVKTASFIYLNSTNNASITGNYTTMTWDTCYKRTTPLKMEEFADTTIKMVIEADASNDPAVDKQSIAALQFYDCGYALSKDGSMVSDIYVHNDNERHSEVGMAEDETTPMGATSGLVVEAT